MKDIITTSWLRGVVCSLPIIAMGILLLLWNFTNPVEVGPVGIFIVFVLLYLFWLGIIFLIFDLLFFLLRIMRRRHSVNRRRTYYMASILAFVPVMLLALQSVGQLEIRDILLVVLFASLAILYIAKHS